MNIILGSISEMEAKALMSALASPHLRQLAFEAVNVSSAIISQPIIGYDYLTEAANNRATVAYAKQPHHSAGLGIEYGLINICERYLYTAVLFLVLPDTEIVATTQGFEIPKQVVHEALNARQTIQTTVQRIMRCNGCRDPISVLTHQRISGSVILMESIKHLLTTVDWASYKPAHSECSF